MALRLVPFLLVALLLAGCGDDPSEPEAREVTVCEVAEPPEPDGEVRVAGATWALPPFTVNRRFILADGGCAVLVLSERQDTIQAREGAQAEVIGSVRALGELELRRLSGGEADETLRLRYDGRRIELDPSTPVIAAATVVGEDLVE